MKSKYLCIVGVVISILLLLVPVFFKSTFTLHMFTLVFFYVALTTAWNIPALGGQLSLGHASFFGVGAYTAAILYVNYGVSPWIGLFIAVGAALLAGTILSLPLIRLRGPFFTLSSIAFAEVLRMVAIDWRSLTNGSVGINIPFKLGFQNMTFKGGEPFYYIFLVIGVITVLIAYWIRNSALGFQMRAAASDDEAARALGVNTSLAQFWGLMWSAGVTGVLGAFYVFYNYVLEPSTAFSMDLFSLQPALNGIIGGVGTVWGPVIGAVLMTPLGEFLRIYLGTIQQGLHYVVYGLVLILTVKFIPGGILSILGPLIKRTNKDRENAN